MALYRMICYSIAEYLGNFRRDSHNKFLGFSWFLTANIEISNLPVTNINFFPMEVNQNISQD